MISQTCERYAFSSSHNKAVAGDVLRNEAVHGIKKKSLPLSLLDMNITVIVCNFFFLLEKEPQLADFIFGAHEI